MATIAIRNGNTGVVTAAGSPLAVLQAIQTGSDILVDGQTAVLTNMGGNWFVNGQPVASLFTVAMGPTVAPPDTHLHCAPGMVPSPFPDGSMRCVPPPQNNGGTPIYYGSGTGPTGSTSSPIIRTDPVAATGPGWAAIANMQWTDAVPWIIGGVVLYYVFFRRSS